MMWIAAILPAYIIQKKDKVNIYGLILSAALFFTFPLTFFSETGWIATTTNYLWVFSMGLLSIGEIHKKRKKTIMAVYCWDNSNLVCNKSGADGSINIGIHCFIGNF
ncbi:hypothetical protein HMPREF2742_04690 [Enterococcus sp. HMSC072H05]|nr:hypothetical protein HMPREF2742_04690 [Enterococcus sp. HMSC072H05]